MDTQKIPILRSPGLNDDFKNIVGYIEFIDKSFERNIINMMLANESLLLTGSVNFDTLTLLDASFITGLIAIQAKNNRAIVNPAAAKHKQQETENLKAEVIRLTKELEDLKKNMEKQTAQINML